jgi:hypothetical protein
MGCIYISIYIYLYIDIYINIFIYIYIYINGIFKWIFSFIDPCSAKEQLFTLGASLAGRLEKPRRHQVLERC